MVLLRVEFEEFFAWLVSHTNDDESVGQPGRCFHSPISRYLSWKTGHVVGEDGQYYGRAVLDACQWQPLPRWAQRFAACSERAFGRALTAYEAVCVLAQVEGNG